MSGCTLSCKATFEQRTVVVVVVRWLWVVCARGVEARGKVQTASNGSIKMPTVTYLPRSNTTVSLPMLKRALCSCARNVGGCYRASKNVK